MTGQTLIFGGDDTLWENNVYFERAIRRSSARMRLAEFLDPGNGNARHSQV
jgi:hypothetical protein